MEMRGVFLAALAFVLLSSCGGNGSGADVVVTVSTPTPTLPVPPTVPNIPTTAPGQPTPTPEPAELVLSAETISVAGTLLVSVTGDVRGGTANFLGRSAPLTQGSQSMYAFLGTGVLDTPGDFELVVEFETRNGSRGRLSEVIEVLPTTWTVDALTIDPGQVQDLLDPEVVAAENALLAEMYATYTPEKLWDGPWQIPTEGPVTGVFGEQRSINGGPASGHHGGTDISAVEGTPVLATNSGRVLMARALDVRGNMVIVDHGGGLLSGYAHLSEFNVSEGQNVEAGQQIALVGNTGLSTGAHLHWEMSVHGILVDAWRFVDGSNGF